MRLLNTNIVVAIFLFSFVGSLISAVFGTIGGVIDKSIQATTKVRMEKENR